MSWSALPDDLKQVAVDNLTRKQLDVLKLHLAGCSTGRIGRMLDITEPTARGHLEAAHRNMRRALEKTHA